MRRVVAGTVATTAAMKPVEVTEYVIVVVRKNRGASHIIEVLVRLHDVGRSWGVHFSRRALRIVEERDAHDSGTAVSGNLVFHASRQAGGSL